jgi:hypothetical protein
MLWQHDLNPRDVNQASQLGKSAKAPSKASLRSLFPHCQTLRLTLNSDRLLERFHADWNLRSDVTALELLEKFE